MQTEQVKWYDRKEPLTQIQILKTIALDGFQSTTSMTDILDSKVTTINTIISKMEDSKHGLIQRIKLEQKTEGKSKHILFSLTEKGINILISNHYENTDKPYLSKIEFEKFMKKYSTEYLEQKDTMDSWKKPSLNEKALLTTYIKSNQTLYKEFKPDTKIGKLRKKIDDLNSELQKNLYETMIYEMKKK